MTQDVARQAMLLYLKAVDLPPERRMTVRAGTLQLVLRALFAAERGSSEDRLAAAEKRADEIFRPVPGQTPGRRLGRKSETSRQRLLAWQHETV